MTFTINQQFLKCLTRKVVLFLIRRFAVSTWAPIWTHWTTELMGGQCWMWGCVIMTSEAQMRGRGTGCCPVPSPTRSSCGLSVEHSQFVIHRICSSRTQVMCGLFLGWSQISEDPIYGGYLQVRVKVLFHFWIWSFRLRKQAVNIGVVYSKAEFVIQALTHGWIPCKQTAFAFPSQSQWTIYTLNEPKPCSKTSRC